MKYLLFVLLLVSNIIYAQKDSTTTNNSQKNHIIKLRILSTIKSFSNINKQFLGLEYEQKLTKRTSLIIDFDIGFFDKYIYYKYHNFLIQNNNLPYTKRTVTTKGFHIAPNYKYYFYNFTKSNLSGFYFGGATDYHYYLKEYKFYDSRNNTTKSTSYSQQQLSVGSVIGFQYLIKKRISIELSTSIYWKILSYINNEEPEINPKNSCWISNNEKFWAVCRFKIGYAF